SRSPRSPPSTKPAKSSRPGTTASGWAESERANQCGRKAVVRNDRRVYFSTMSIISTGFGGRRRSSRPDLPPGQYLTKDFPVLSAGPTPRIALDRWQFTIDDGRNVLKRWDWKSFRELPTETITVDLHCVTRWSKLNTSWEGVSLDILIADLKTDLPYAMFRSSGDYTTNLPLKDVMNKQ